MENGLIYISIALVIVYWLYKKIACDVSYFADQKIVFEKPLPLVGNTLGMLTKKEGLIQFVRRLYDFGKNEKIVGFFGFSGQKGFLIKDPGMIKQIAIKDFDHFVNRDPDFGFETDKLMSKTILLLHDQKWKDMRSTISPIFTSSKMKYIFGLLTDCVGDFIEFYEEKAKANAGTIEVDTRDVYARITADGIATTALGFKGDCVRNKDSKIYEIAEETVQDFAAPQLVQMLFSKAPFLYNLFGFQILRKSVQEFYHTNVLGEIQRRRQVNASRPDMIQLLVQAKEGQLKADAGDAVQISNGDSKVKKNFNWTDEDLVAQALVIFLGGFETTATLMQAMSFELSRNQEIQATLASEVDEMLETLDGKTISYDQLNQMKFLDMVVSECLRKWPSATAASRNCSKDYLLKDNDTGKTYKINKGTDIFFSIIDIQNDPKYFPNPEKFDPYRFSEDNKVNMDKDAYLPFGLGPRICIGTRYALLEAKLLLFSIISKFSIEVTKNTPKKITNSLLSTLGYEEKIYVAFKLRK